MIVVLPLPEDRCDREKPLVVGVNPEYVMRVEPYRGLDMARVVLEGENYHCIAMSFNDTVKALNKGKK